MVSVWLSQFTSSYVTLCVSLWHLRPTNRIRPIKVRHRQSGAASINRWVSSAVMNRSFSAATDEDCRFRNGFLVVISFLIASLKIAFAFRIAVRTLASDFFDSINLSR